MSLEHITTDQIERKFQPEQALVEYIKAVVFELCNVKVSVRKKRFSTYILIAPSASAASEIALFLPTIQSKISDYCRNKSLQIISRIIVRQ